MTPKEMQVVYPPRKTIKRTFYGAFPVGSERPTGIYPTIEGAAKHLAIYHALNGGNVAPIEIEYIPMRWEITESAAAPNG
jgi:hypothetical protein